MPQQLEFATTQPKPEQDDNDERLIWREKLRQHLQDPALRQIPGFPLGTEEAILALSDPPTYTACPNPFLLDILAQWQSERAQIRQELGLFDDGDISSPGENRRDAEDYHRDPFASDVSEGKNNPIYNAHSYHTKVPHKAIMRYILHYTDPGDVVLDGFCGTGMTGVAAQLCDDRKEVESLGYFVDDAGNIYEKPPDPMVENQTPLSKLGTRKAILVDLSPAATFIAYNYNTPVDARTFEYEAKRILREVEEECGWMYKTLHTDGKTKGKINYTVWSDVFLCPQCGGEMAFWDVAVDQEHGKVRKEWECPHCRTRLSKSPRRNSDARRVERAFDTYFDRAIGQTVRQAKQSPVLINYSVGKKRYKKHPDTNDLALIQKIEGSEIPYPTPTFRMPEGDESRRNDDLGITHVHHFYTQRNLWILATTIKRAYGRRTLFVITALIRTLTKMFRWAPRGKHTAGTSGTLYIPSITHEYPIFKAIRRRLTLYQNLLAHLEQLTTGDVYISTQSGNNFLSPDDSVDYIFIDPPFGANLMYSELNFLWESWLGVFTNNTSEAVINKAQSKELFEYQNLMEGCLCEFYRILKPGHWMTVEFHNSQNTVWNAIQEALLHAGFMIADVRILDKKQGTFKQITSTSAVKQDLIISVYKPQAEFERRFLAEGGSTRGAWDFTHQHLEQLAPPSLKDGAVLGFIEERAPYVLYDRMVAYHVHHGLPVPLSAPEFYAGLQDRFISRDGMIFTPTQVAFYDQLRLEADRVEQLPLFITKEDRALEWLQRALDPEQGGRPQTYQDLNPNFKQELHQLKHEVMPEMLDLLKENFLRDEVTAQWHIPDPAKASDLQALREKSLLREFNSYLNGRGRLKAFRSEAVRAGFSRAWKERDYETIVKVAERLSQRALQEDSALLMYVDNARLRAGDRPKQTTLF